jgi:hypothetical protein
MFRYLATEHIPDDVPRAYRRMMEVQKDKFLLRNGRLFRRLEFNELETLVPYLPKQERLEKMKQLHEVMGHLSSPSIAESLKRRWWWPNLSNDLVAFIRSCDHCQRFRSLDRPPPNPMYPLPPPGIPFHTWGIDFIEDLPETQRGNKHILDAICHATKRYVAKAVPDKSSGTIALFLYELTLQFGAPSVVISDRGLGFMSQVLRDYLELLRTNHYPTTPYHPQCNGAVERAHAIVKPILESMTVGCVEKWDDFVPSVVFKMNIRTHSVTGFSPFQLCYGFNPRLPGDLTPPTLFDLRNEEDQVLFTQRELTLLGQNRAAALSRLQEQANRMAQIQLSKRRVQPSPYKVGQLVKKKINPMAKFRPRFEPDWDGPFRISKLIRDVYHLETLDGTPLPNPYNHDILAPWHTYQP